MLPFTSISAIRMLWFAATCTVLAIGLHMGCAYHSLPQKTDYSIKLRWCKAHAAETWPEVRIGLIWAFSYLGATVPKGSFDAAVKASGNNTYELDIRKIGFSTAALKAWEPLLKAMRETEEYRTHNGIDIGRFLMFTQQSAWHYYALAEIPASLHNFENQYFNSNVVSFKLSHSTVSRHQRLIRFEPSANYLRIAFIGAEGTGLLEDNSFRPKSFETIDVMTNGQLRFGIYASDGNLKSAADTVLTIGGKPGKCQWCHEKTLLPLYTPSVELPASISRNQFTSFIDTANRLINEYRKTLSTDITYESPQDHHFAELLTISYLEPSAMRLASEWGISEADVLKKLQGLATHTHPEYPFLGALYHRADVEKFTPFQCVAVPESAREFSNYEPNLFQ